MIEIGKFASEQLSRTDLSEAERRAVENVIASTGPFNKEDSKFVLSKELLNLFLEGKIRHEALIIGGEEAGLLEQEISKSKIRSSSDTRYMLKSEKFTTLKDPNEVDLFLLTLKDMGLSDYSTTTQINKRKDELGLDFCPAEVGPHYRLKYTNQPLNEHCVVWHKPITDSRGVPGVFGLGCGDGGLWLGVYWARSDRQWSPEYVFVLSLCKLET